MLIIKACVNPFLVIGLILLIQKLPAYFQQTRIIDRYAVYHCQHSLQPDDTIFLPRIHPHTYLVLSDTAKMLFMLSPAGKNEAFFQFLSQVKMLLSPAEMQEIFAAYGQKLVGPPLTAA